MSKVLSEHRRLIEYVLMLSLVLFLTAARTNDRYTGRMAAMDWSQQHLVDARQDSAIDTIKSFVGLE